MRAAMHVQVSSCMLDDELLPWGAGEGGGVGHAAVARHFARGTAAARPG